MTRVWEPRIGWLRKNKLIGVVNSEEGIVDPDKKIAAARTLLSAIMHNELSRFGYEEGRLLSRIDILNLIFRQVPALRDDCFRLLEGMIDIRVKIKRLISECAKQGASPYFPVSGVLPISSKEILEMPFDLLEGVACDENEMVQPAMLEVAA